AVAMRCATDVYALSTARVGPAISAPSMRWKCTRCPPASTTATETRAPSSVARASADDASFPARSRVTIAMGTPWQPAARLSAAQERECLLDGKATDAVAVPADDRVGGEEGVQRRLLTGLRDGVEDVVER